MPARSFLLSKNYYPTNTCPVGGYMNSESGHPRNQLDRVICQVRFPAILEIDKRIDEIQRLLRSEYPLYSQSAPIQLNLANAPLPTDHTFQTNDGSWSVTVSVSAISLTTTKYTEWVQFRERFERVASSAIQLYGITEFVRIGLRYINAIRPSSLGMDEPKKVLDKPYSDLINSNLGPVNGINCIIDYDAGASIRGRSVVGTIIFTDGEQGALVDNDIFSETRAETSNLMYILDRMNAASLDAFKKIVSNETSKQVIE